MISAKNSLHIARRIPLFLSRTRNRKRARSATRRARGPVAYARTHTHGPADRTYAGAFSFTRAGNREWHERPWADVAPTHGPGSLGLSLPGFFSMNEFTPCTSLLPRPSSPFSVIPLSPRRSASPLSPPLSSPLPSPRYASFRLAYVYCAWPTLLHGSSTDEGIQSHVRGRISCDGFGTTHW